MGAADAIDCCPACGNKGLVADQCQICGCIRAEYHKRQPWIVPISQTVSIGDPKFDPQRREAQRRQHLNEDVTYVAELKQQRPEPVRRKRNKKQEETGQDELFVEVNKQ